MAAAMVKILLIMLSQTPFIGVHSLNVMKRGGLEEPCQRLTAHHGTEVKKHLEMIVVTYEGTRLLIETVDGDNYYKSQNLNDTTMHYALDKLDKIFEGIDWNHLLEGKPVKKKLRRTGHALVRRRFDPATHNRDGDCLYACLSYGQRRKLPSDEAIRQMRRQMLRWWVSTPGLLRQVAEEEGIRPAAYLRQFVRQGWGGYPEIRLFVKNTGLAVKVVSPRGRILMECGAGSQECVELQYNGVHYVVRNVQARYRCSMTPPTMSGRGGMPGVKLRAKAEIPADHRLQERGVVDNAPRRKVKEDYLKEPHFVVGYASKGVEDDRFSEASDREGATVGPLEKPRKRRRILARAEAESTRGCRPKMKAKVKEEQPAATRSAGIDLRRAADSARSVRRSRQESGQEEASSPLALSHCRAGDDNDPLWHGGDTIRTSKKRARDASVQASRQTGDQACQGDSEDEELAMLPKEARPKSKKLARPSKEVAVRRRKPKKGKEEKAATQEKEDIRRDGGEALHGHRRVKMKNKKIQTDKEVPADHYDQAELPPARDAPSVEENPVRIGEPAPPGGWDQRVLAHMARLNKQEEELDDEIILADHKKSPYLFCFGCRKWADPQHRSSKNHLKLVRWLYGLPRVQRLMQQKEMWAWAEKYLKERDEAKKAAWENQEWEEQKHDSKTGAKPKGRGGAQGEACNAAQGVTARIAFDPVEDQGTGASVGSAGQSYKEGVALPLSPGGVAGDDHDGCDKDLQEEEEGTPQMKQDEGDSNLESGSEELVGEGITKIWIRGPRSWLPVSRCRSTTLQELRELCAIHLKLSSCAITLCHGEVPLPPHGLCDQYIPMGTVDLWAAPVHMLARVSRPPTAPAPSMRSVEGRCPLCQTGAQCEIETQDDQMTEMEETLYMVENDKNVQTVNVQHHKKLVKLQFYQGCTVGGLRATYAKVKKIGKERIKPYWLADDEQALEEGDSLLLTMATAGRGGTGMVYLHIKGAWKEHATSADTTTREIREKWNHEGCIIYKGAKLHDFVKIEMLKGADLYAVESHYGPVIRPYAHCAVAKFLHFAELQEWFSPEQDAILEEDGLQAVLLASYSRWQKAKQQVLFYHKNSGRGGVGNRISLGRLPWESTRTIVGLKLAVEVRSSDKKIEQISVDEVTESACGVTLMLMSTWARLKHIESSKPLLALFPGKCAAALKRLGADPARCAEFELLFTEPLEGRHVKRQVTALSMSKETFTYGANMTTVEWVPEASVEMLLELDERWSSPLIKRAAEDSWRDLAVKLVGRMTLEVVQAENLYALKSPGALPPRVWSARIRLSQAVAEKLICSSGLEGLFVKHLNVVQLDDQSSHTIVWGPRHESASPSELTKFLEVAAQLPGHRGVARSMAGLGIRVLWKQVKTAREKLRGEDPSLCSDTMAMIDNRWFKLQGAPAGASTEEVRKFLLETGWKCIPHRKQVTRDTAVWYISSDTEPVNKCLKWGPLFLFLEEASAQEIREKRAETNKRRLKAVQQNAMGVPMGLQGKSVEQGEGTRDQKDPFLQADPWMQGRTRSDSGRVDSSSQSSAGSARWRSTIASHSGPTNDPRVDALMTRMTTMEEKQHSLEDKVGRVEGSIDQLNNSMSTQFREVLKSLAALADSQRGEQPDAKRKPTAGGGGGGTQAS